MNQSKRARKRTTAPPSSGDTTATALTGIVSNEHHLARRGNPQRPVRSGVNLAGRILGGLTAIAITGGLAATGAAARSSKARTKQETILTANGVHAQGAVSDYGPAAQVFAKPLVGIAPTPNGDGYWIAAADGGVFAYGAARFRGSAGNLKLVQPVVGIAATPSGNGYWLVAKDGGIFTFGDAKFRGSASGISRSEVVGIAATPSGNGYWLVAKDGGIFTFGDAKFRGSAAQFPIASPIVGMAVTSSGQGYTLVAQDGGVFAFGNADFAGSAYATIPNDAVGIARIDNGYAIARATGAVVTFGTSTVGAGDPQIENATVTTVAIATSSAGYWTVQASRGAIVDHMDPFLVCTRHHESSPHAPGFDDGYQAINPSGRYFGAYQFDISTWNNTARHAGRPDLEGVRPDHASTPDQDALAWDLFQWQGYRPWVNRCMGLK